MLRIFKFLGLRYWLFGLLLSGWPIQVAGFLWWSAWLILLFSELLNRKVSGTFKLLSFAYSALAVANILLFGQLGITRIVLAVFFTLGRWAFDSFFLSAALDRFSLKLRRFGQSLFLLALLSAALLDAFYITLNTDNQVLLVWPLLFCVLFLVNDAFGVLRGMFPGKVRILFYS